MIVQFTHKEHQSGHADSLRFGKKYLVLEMHIGLNPSEHYFRVVSEKGIPALFEMQQFSIASGQLDGYILLQYPKGNYVVSLQEIATSEFESQNVDGFFGCYFDSNDTTIQGLLSSVVSMASKREGIEAPLRVSPTGVDDNTGREILHDALIKYISYDMSAIDFSARFDQFFSDYYSPEQFTGDEQSSIFRLSLEVQKLFPADRPPDANNENQDNQDLYAAALIAGEALGLQ